MKLKHLLFALLVACGAGTNWVGTKIAVDHFPPFLNVAMRFLILVIIFSPWIKPINKQFGLIVLIALTLGVFQFSFMFLALSLASNVATIAIANQIYIPFSVILAVIFLKEKVDFIRWSAIALAFVGIIIMAFDPIAFFQLDAIFVVCLSALSLSISSILMRSLKSVGVFQLQGWVALIALFPVTILSIIFEYSNWSDVLIAPPNAWFAFFYGIVAGSLLFHAGWYYLLKKYPVSTISPIMLLMPLSGILSGYLVYGDDLTIKIILGGSFTMIGVATIILKEKEKSL